MAAISAGCAGDTADEGSSSGGTSGAPGTTLGADASVGGSSGTSGNVATGGGSGCSGAAADPASAAVVEGFIGKVPTGNGPKDASVRAAVVDAILRTCEVFGPKSAKDPGWDARYCWAHLAASIGKESSYAPALTIKDGYGQRAIGSAKANDPTVGLLQIRFSSTVRDFAAEGPRDALACIGCAIPADVASHVKEPGDSPYWAVTGPTANSALLQNVACNVGLGGWYYYVNATGNGNAAAPTYVSPYCAGKGTSGNLVTGLLSHLKGPSGGKGVIRDMGGVSALQRTDSNAYQYVTLIKRWFDSMVGSTNGTHPFFLSLAPSPDQYCAP